MAEAALVIACSGRWRWGGSSSDYVNTVKLQQFLCMKHSVKTLNCCKLSVYCSAHTGRIKQIRVANKGGSTTLLEYFHGNATPLQFIFTFIRF